MATLREKARKDLQKAIEKARRENENPSKVNARAAKTSYKYFDPMSDDDPVAPYPFAKGGSQPTDAEAVLYGYEIYNYRGHWGKFLPPRSLLSDYHFGVLAQMAANGEITAKTLRDYWAFDFTREGKVRPGRPNRGTPYHIYDHGQLVYGILDDRYPLMGTECAVNSVIREPIVDHAPNPDPRNPVKQFPSAEFFATGDADSYRSLPWDYTRADPSMFGDDELKVYNDFLDSLDERQKRRLQRLRMDNAEFAKEHVRGSKHNDNNEGASTAPTKRLSSNLTTKINALLAERVGFDAHIRTSHGTTALTFSVKPENILALCEGPGAQILRSTIKAANGIADEPNEIKDTLIARKRAHDSKTTPTDDNPDDETPIPKRPRAKLPRFLTKPKTVEEMIMVKTELDNDPPLAPNAFTGAHQCWKCLGTQTHASDCFYSDVICGTCNKKGHARSNCPQAPSNQAMQDHTAEMQKSKPVYGQAPISRRMIFDSGIPWANETSLTAAPTNASVQVSNPVKAKFSPILAAAAKFLVASNKETTKSDEPHVVKPLAGPDFAAIKSTANSSRTKSDTTDDTCESTKPNPLNRNAPRKSTRSYNGLMGLLDIEDEC